MTLNVNDVCHYLIGHISSNAIFHHVQDTTYLAYATACDLNSSQVKIIAHL